MDPSTITPPTSKMAPMTAETITEHSIASNNNATSPRLLFLLSSLITHLHAFTRETRLSTAEWEFAIDFLTRVGHTCTPTRQEFILLSDVLGLSTLVESLNHPKPPSATEGTVLGPFHTHDAAETDLGGSIASDGKGEVCLVRGKVVDAVTGAPLPGAKIDVWETDASGHYDTQYSDRSCPDCRGIITTADDGSFFFKAVRPVPYPIPVDGPVGELLRATRRHPYRPSHMHFLIKADRYDTLVTSLYPKGDPYEDSDAVFGVKKSLLVELGKVRREEAGKYGVKEGDWDLQWTFGMVGQEEARRLRIERAERQLAEMGSRARIVEGLPVAELD